jgi:hypothetical protein
MHVLCRSGLAHVYCGKYLNICGEAKFFGPISPYIWSLERQRQRERERGCRSKLNPPWGMESLTDHECVINNLRPSHLIVTQRTHSLEFTDLPRELAKNKLHCIVRCGCFIVRYDCFIVRYGCFLCGVPKKTANQLTPSSTARLEDQTTPHILKFWAICGNRNLGKAFKRVRHLSLS